MVDCYAQPNQSHVIAIYHMKLYCIVWSTHVSQHTDIRAQMAATAR